MRTSRRLLARSARRAAMLRNDGGPARSDAEARVRDEIAAWRERAVPDAVAPLEADDLVRLLRELFAALALERAIVSDLSVSTVHYYRRKDIIDPPDGRTVAARYQLRHLWQVAGARLAGHLGLVTLAEARSAMRDAREETLLAFLAARVVDARARTAVRTSRVLPSAIPSAVSSAPSNGPSSRPSSGRAASVPRPLPHRAGASRDAQLPTATPATMIPLPGNAWCVLPEAHAAHRSSDAAAELAHALVNALHPHRRS